MIPKILRSVTSYMEDFSTYTIEPRIKRFLKILLTKSVKLTPGQKAHSFEDDVIGHDSERIEAYERLKNALNPYSSGLWSTSPGEKPKKPTETQVKTWMKKAADAEERFLDLLTKDEVERFRKDAVPFLYKRERTSPKLEMFDLKAAKRWIAKRSYDYGWTQKRFGNDKKPIW